ncbi:MAG: response regulator transcription factor [Chloroflexota bacterium]
MSNETILVVDDEVNIRDLARLYLEQAGFQVQMATNGAQALAVIKQKPPDLVVLDLMLPEVDGLEVCRRVRATSRLPILMLTAKDEAIDKVLGLELGADDYLTKPFSPHELVARVRAILRRTGPAAPLPPTSARHFGNLVIDPAGRDVTLDGRRITLRAKEFDLLLTLVDHPNQVFSRDQLLDLVWGYDYFGQTRTVDVHVAQLREKLNGSPLIIETVWGLGYKLVLGPMNNEQ